ncbi:signal transduction histidine kinase (STHK), LytS [Pseudanabaena sp. FACHB-1998]|uniref:general stress protein n=1 Tax=Pseudanabaena sp. FACHB-1998 TaxID=2692858 RepID=UPI001680232A|nr:general stress protein [Pseudanabaena sp. FACHB-1998]MBD2178684.1 signal transduction histidine kinase (STHK), LytS [Pseudanabaena sp. FACHB-1998]
MSGQNKRATGTFSNPQEAKGALHELRDSGFNMDQISIIGNHIDRNSDLAGISPSENISDLDNKVGEGAATGAASIGAVGSFTGLLVGLGLVAIPGIGPIMLAGATATTLATTLTGGAIGAAAGGLIGALVGLGIPQDRAKEYCDRLDQGDYLVMVDGSEPEILQAEVIFKRYAVQEWGIYDNN